MKRWRQTVCQALLQRADTGQYVRQRHKMLPSYYLTVIKNFSPSAPARARTPGPACPLRRRRYCMRAEAGEARKQGAPFQQSSPREHDAAAVRRETAEKPQIISTKTNKSNRRTAQRKYPNSIWFVYEIIVIIYPNMKIYQVNKVNA